MEKIKLVVLLVRNYSTVLRKWLKWLLMLPFPLEAAAAGLDGTRMMDI